MYTSHKKLITFMQLGACGSNSPLIQGPAGWHRAATPPSLFYVWALDKRRLRGGVCGVKGQGRLSKASNEFKKYEISRQMEAIRGSSNLAQPTRMISRRDVNQKWLSIWRGGERNCQLVTTWLVCTGQEWSLFEYGSCRDRISPELS